MKLTLTRTLAAAMFAGLPCGVSLADLPPALARVSADAPMIISISSVAGFMDEAQSFISVLGQNEAVQVIDEARGFLGMPGINPNGSAAIVFNTIEGVDNMDGPPIVALVPVTDYNQVVTNLGGSGNGLELLNFQGEDVYIKNIGNGFAAIAPQQALLEGFQPVDDASAAHATAMGAAGQMLASDHTFMVIADVAAFSETMIEGWGQASQQMAMFGQMGGQGEQVQQQIKTMDMIVRTFARDGQRGMVGLSGGEAGITLDLAASFKEGSELAGFFDQAGNAANLVGRLPGGSYIMAWAADTSGAGISKLLLNAAEMNPGAQIPGLNPAQFVENSNGFAQVIGTSPAGIMGGIFVNTTAIMDVDNAGDFIKTYGESLAEMNNQTTQGMTFTTNFADAPEQIDGVEAHRWAMKMLPDLDNPNAQQMQMAMPMLFGPSGGPNGYVAAANDTTVVMTYSTSRQALTTAVGAARDGGTLTNDRLFMNQAQRLHSEAVMVGYVDVGSIVRMTLPMAAMFIGQVDVQIPDAVTPVAMSMTADGGSMSFRTVVPTDVIELVKDLGEAFSEMNGGGMGGDDDAPQF